MTEFKLNRQVVEQQVNQAERFYFITMEVTKDYRINKNEGAKSISNYFMAILHDTMISDVNYSNVDAEAEIEYLFKQHVIQGIPSDENKVDEDFLDRLLKAVLILACQGDVVELMDNIDKEEV